MLDTKFFIRVGANVRDKYRKHIFAKARDVYGKSFKGYSKEYGDAKRANKFKGQSGRSLNTNAPILTGALLNDFTLIKTMSNGFQLGWAAQGAKIKWLKKLGRVLTEPNQPLPKGIIQYISSEVRPYINKKLPKGKKTYRIGR